MCSESVSISFGILVVMGNRGKGTDAERRGCVCEWCVVFLKGKMNMPWGYGGGSADGGRPAEGRGQIYKRVRYREWIWEPRIPHPPTMLRVWKEEGQCEYIYGDSGGGYWPAKFCIAQWEGGKCGVRDG